MKNKIFNFFPNPLNNSFSGGKIMASKRIGITVNDEMLQFLNKKSESSTTSKYIRELIRKDMEPKTVGQNSDVCRTLLEELYLFFEHQNVKKLKYTVEDWEMFERIEKVLGL